MALQRSGDWLFSLWFSDVVMGLVQGGELVIRTAHTNVQIWAFLFCKNWRSGQSSSPAMTLGWELIKNVKFAKFSFSQWSQGLAYSLAVQSDFPRHTRVNLTAHCFFCQQDIGNKDGSRLILVCGTSHGPRDSPKLWDPNVWQLFLQSSCVCLFSLSNRHANWLWHILLNSSCCRNPSPMPRVTLSHIMFGRFSAARQPQKHWDVNKEWLCLPSQHQHTASTQSQPPQTTGLLSECFHWKGRKKEASISKTFKWLDTISWCYFYSFCSSGVISVCSSSLESRGYKHRSLI